jgi:DmsE family decaheme c-type cytochrome
LQLQSRLIIAVSIWVALSFSIGHGGQDPTPHWKRQGEFVKDRQICADCHDEENEDIAEGYHVRVPDQKGLQSCETCHGPGKEHVESEDSAKITHPARLSGKAQRQLCATCHEEQILDHGGPLEVLLAAGKKCSTCHRIHEPKDLVPGSKDPHHFRSRAESVMAAKNVGMKACVDCHGDKETNLNKGPHRELLAESNQPQESCETCHGPGSLHVDSLGLRRLISRPDVARDGSETCRSCHEEVDPVDFHWDRKHWPLLGAPKGAQLTCTTCHRVHDIPPQADALDSQLPPGACLACHSPAYDALQGRVHASLSRWDQGLGRGCVSCHPGAGQHVRSGGRPELVASPHTQTQQKAICSSCHGKQDKVCGYVFGIHGRKGVACLDCHTSAPENTPKARAQDASSGCATCHKRAAASFRGPRRGHPVGENKFTCASCHEAHKQTGVTLVSAWKTQFTCTGCHKEYQGPFLFEHNAKRGEGCLSCHVAHNNSHPKLLPARRIRDNCLPCHADLPAFHDQGPGSVFRNCLDCHTQIHGSNRNRHFFR